MKKKVTIIVLFIIAFICVIFCSIFIYSLMLNNIKKVSKNEQRILLLSKVNEINNHVGDLDFELNELVGSFKNNIDLKDVKKIFAPFINKHKLLMDIYLISKHKLLYSYSKDKESFILNNKLNTASRFNWILSENIPWSLKFNYLNSLTLNLVLFTSAFKIEYQGKSQDVLILAKFDNSMIVNKSDENSEKNNDSVLWILNSAGTVIGSTPSFKKPKDATKAFNQLLDNKKYITDTLDFELNACKFKMVLTRNVQSIKNSVFPFKLKLIYIIINIFIICLMVLSIPILLYYDKRYKTLKNKIKKLNIKIDESEKKKIINKIPTLDVFKELASNVKKKETK